MSSQRMQKRELTEALLEDNRRLRNLLRELRKVIITNKHKQLIDQELKTSK